VVSSVFSKFDELVGALLLVVGRLGRAGRVDEFLCAHRGKLFLHKSSLLDQSRVTQTLAHVSDFVIPGRIDLEAKFAGVV